MGADLFHADRRMDMMPMIVFFSNFSKAHKTTTTTLTLDQKGQFYIYFRNKTFLISFDTNACDITLFSIS